MKILIAGGGTGGHIFPGIAIAEALKTLRPETDIEFIGTEKGAEFKLVPQNGFKLNLIELAGFSRVSMKANLTFPIKLLKGFLQSNKLINDFRPDAVVATGGYVCGPVTRIAQWKKIKTFVQEQNAVPGFTTKELAKKATKVFATYEDSIPFFESDVKSKIEVQGNPVRKNLNTFKREEAFKFFNLNPTKKTILVFGGSQGARSINKAVSDQYEKMVRTGIQLIWQTGKTDNEFPPIKDEYKDSVFRSAFINEMGLAYAASDLVVSRAGATSLAEITYVGIPSILIPLPTAADDHQTKNAMVMKNKGASVLILDSMLNEQFGNTISQIMLDIQLLDKMKTAAKGLAKPNAAEEIAKQILKEIEG